VYGDDEEADACGCCGGWDGNNREGGGGVVAGTAAAAAAAVGARAAVQRWLSKDSTPTARPVSLNLGRNNGAHLSPTSLCRRQENGRQVRTGSCQCGAVTGDGNVIFFITIQEMHQQTLPVEICGHTGQLPLVFIVTQVHDSTWSQLLGSPQKIRGFNVPLAIVFSTHIRRESQRQG